MTPVTNALIDVRFTLDIPPEKVVAICGEDDGSEDWFQKAYDKLEHHMQDMWHDYLDYMHNAEAEIEVTM